MVAKTMKAPPNRHTKAIKVEKATGTKANAKDVGTAEARIHAALAVARLKVAALPSKSQPRARGAKDLLAAVRSTMSRVPYRGAAAAGVQLQPAMLISIDSKGFPRARTMILSHVEPDLSEVWMNTRKDTQKVARIMANEKVCLHFQDPQGRGGWTTLVGQAELRSADEDGDVEICVRPELVELVSHTDNAMGDEEGYVPAKLLRKKEATEGWVVATQ